MSIAHMPYSPIHMRSEDFVEIEPITREDGRVLRRWHLRGYPDVIGTEDPMDQTFKVGPIERRPMEMPKGDVFYLSAEYDTQVFEALNKLGR